MRPQQRDCTRECGRSGHAVPLLLLATVGGAFAPQMIAVASLDASSSALLPGPRGVAVYEDSGIMWAIVTSRTGNGVTLIDVTTPSSPVVKSIVTNADLQGAFGVATYAVDGLTHAIVTAADANGLQVIDVSQVRQGSQPQPTAFLARTLTS